MAADRIDRLTKRQRECLRLVGELRTSKEIAVALGISPHTVDGHVNDGVAALGATTRYEAARLLVEHDRDVALTPQRLTGEPSPVVDTPVPEPSRPGSVARPSTGRTIRLGPWQRIGIIIGLAIGLVYAVVLLLLGSEAIERFVRVDHAPKVSTIR